MIIPTGKNRIMDEFWFPLTSREVNIIPKIVQNIKLGYSWRKLSSKYGIT